MRTQKPGTIVLLVILYLFLRSHMKKNIYILSVVILCNFVCAAQAPRTRTFSQSIPVTQEKVDLLAAILREAAINQQSQDNTVVVVRKTRGTIMINGKIINNTVSCTQTTSDCLNIEGDTENSDTIDINAVISSDDRNESECIVPEVKTSDTDKIQNVSITTKFTNPHCRESIAYRIRIPATLLTHLTTEITQGNTTVKNITGSLQHETGSGNITGDTITGNVRAKTVSGNQEFTNIGESFKGRSVFW